MKNTISTDNLQHSQIEEDLKLLDDLELSQMIEEAKQEIKDDKTLSHNEVRKRLNFRD